MKDSEIVDNVGRREIGEDLIDTSRMNKEQREALEVAEAAREASSVKASFGSQLFMGCFEPEHLTPFPFQSPEEEAIGEDLVDRLSDYLKEHLDPEKVDETRTIPSEVVEELVRQGVFAMKIPKEYDGLGLSQVNYNRVMMMLASHCGSTAVLVSAHQSIGVPQPLKLFGTEQQKRKYLPRFRKGAISAFALTEPDVGSDPAQMSTIAEPSEDGGHYILNGEKLWCTNGTIADIIVVMAQTPAKVIRGRERKQITAFIVEADWEGVEVAHRCDFMGIRGIQNGLLRFKNVKVPKENILFGEGKGLKLALVTLNTGRLTLPAACTGMAKQCLSIARRWGKHRKQWGAAVGMHEAGRTKIASIAANTFAMEAITLLTSHWADQGDKDIRIEAAMAKLFCSEMAWQVVDETMQLRGGRGYEKASSLRARGEPAFPVERMMRECRINRIIEGTTEVMKLFLAREAMDPHLRIAAGMLKRKAPTSEKLRAGVNMAAYYGGWYPRQWVNASAWHAHEEAGGLGTEFRFIESASHRLARTIFHYMGIYQDRLEKRQNILGHLMEIGTELFAIAATCSYANGLVQRNPDDRSPLDLAKLFSEQSKLRIGDHYRSLKLNADREANAMAKRVLADEFKWLEAGILESEPNAYPED
ncbi:acyl-CoA dehydrogenase family protein [Pelagicoccus mobilis]|uniref:Acyl-CoA dehydrogenase family protein n=1 Tax=Pelagicoccus mobilis TaxID=415221 RepID=A0A934S0Y7_9BACT|nr:acyl-CoA dehydrogenase family protein [Pelagicoccus mobilis]MBK1880331.1 acyl-CoA dehydrogenase family protein [Pelagicoccus mobilis]